METQAFMASPGTEELVTQLIEGLVRKTDANQLSWEKDDIADIHRIHQTRSTIEVTRNHQNGKMWLSVHDEQGILVLSLDNSVRPEIVRLYDKINESRQRNANRVIASAMNELGIDR